MKYTLFSMLLLLSLLLVSCQHGDRIAVTEAVTTDMPYIAETLETLPVETASAVPTHPYTFSLENGEEETIILTGNDPEFFAELHLAQLDDTDVLNRIILHRRVSGSGVSVEHAHVFDGTTGDALAVTDVGDVIAQYVTVRTTDTAWILTVAGVDYTIEKAQFADYPAEELCEVPDFSMVHDFSVENGQLYCTVRILCAGPGTGFASESLRIRYSYQDGAIVPAEIMFLKTEPTPNSPVSDTAEAAEAT